MARLRSYLLLTLVVSVLLGWAAAVDSGRILDTWAFLFDTETDTGNVITADTLGNPGTLSATAFSPTQIDLSWGASNDAYATHYELYRCNPGPSCTPTTLVTGAALAEGSLGATCSTPTTGTCAYSNTSLTASTQYCYRARTAYLISGTPVWQSGYSNTACATTPAEAQVLTVTLVPHMDKANTSGTGNDWNSGASGNPACGTTSTTNTCASQIDEDIDSATPDYIYNDSPSTQLVEFTITDPTGLQTLTDISVRFRGDRVGDRACTFQVEVFKGDGTLLGSGSAALTTTAANYAFNITGLSLTAAEANALYVRVTSSQPGTGSPSTCRLYALNLDITYLGTP